MLKLKAAIFGLIFSLVLLQNAFAGETAPAPPVIVKHTFTGYSSAGDTVILDLTVHVVNPGDSTLSNVTLTLVPMRPFISGRSTLDVGNLAPRQSADFPLQLKAVAIGMDRIAHRPLFFAGKCDDANGTQVEFPAASNPESLSKKLHLQNLQSKPSPSSVAAPLTYQSSAVAAPASAVAEPGDFLFKWGNQYPPYPRSVAVDSAGNLYVADNGIYGIQVYDSSGNFVRSWGGYGTGTGQFDDITGLAVDSDGNVYVADSGNCRIQVFDSFGKFLRTWGSYGVENDQFDGLTGVAVDGAGNVYAADRFAVRVQVFDSGGNFLRTLGSWGSGDGQYQSPTGLAVDSGGNVYVTDTYYNRIEIYDSSGNFVRTLGNSVPPGYGQFSDPEGVAVDSGGNIYVADTGNYELQEFDSSGNFVRSWGYYGSGNGQFSGPYGVAVNSAGNVYVADSGNSRVQVFTGAGTYVSTIGDRSAYGSFYQLSGAGVAVDSGGNVYVADTGNHRIQAFDSSGKFLRAWGGYGSGDGQFEYPQGVAVDANGNIYVADGGNNRVQIFDNMGIFLRNIEGSIGTGHDPITWPICVAVDTNGNIYVGDYGDGFGRMLVFDNAGTFVRTDGALPRGIAVDASGNAYVASAHDWGGQVMVFDSAGTFLRQMGNDQVQLFGGGIAVDTSNNVFVTDIGLFPSNGRVLLFDTMGSFKGTWGSEGIGDGQFHVPTGMAVNKSCTVVYVGDSGNNRIQAFVGYGTPSFTVNFIAGSHGSISGTASQTVTSGQNATAVTAVPDSGYRFVNWTGDNGFIATADNPLTVMNVTASQTITANFAANAPLTTTATVNGTAGTNGWYVSEVGISFSAFEAKEICTKLDKRPEKVTAGSAATLSITSEGHHAVKYYAVDNAGNQESPHTLNINIDKTPPAIKIIGKKGAVYVLGRKIPIMRYTVRDKLSGMASDDAALTGGNANHAGIFTYTVTAADKAGNTATKTATYTVRYIFSRFLPRRGKKFQAGSIVPVTFLLKDAKGNFISTASAALWLKSPSGAPVTPTSSTNTGNVFQYDPNIKRYIYNLNTAGLAVGRWQLQVLLDDGSPVKTTFIKLK